MSSRTRPAAARRRPTRGVAPSYHHGDLRRALLDVTESLLEEAGVEGFTLREVARRAGVSHGAPAHHFGDVRGLLSAFSAQSFEQLAEAMQRHRNSAAADPFAQLVAVGVAYVEYALQQRARFLLMFRSDRLDRDLASLQEAGAHGYRHLVETVAALDPAADSAALDDRAALAWSMVHGFATLTLENAHFAAAHGPSIKHAISRVERLLQMTRACFEPPGDAPAPAIRRVVAAPQRRR